MRATQIKAIVDTFLRSEDFATWSAERVESGGYARPGSDSRERFERCYDAAENGADGSTHRECIEDMREGFRAYLHNRRTKSEYPYRIEDAVMRHFDDLEAWHEANGSLDEEIG